MVNDDHGACGGSDLMKQGSIIKQESEHVSLTTIILTFNEHLHIRRCIENVRRVASHVVVVDSGSTDDTVSIARSLGAVVFTNQWINHAVQFNWALDHADINTEWVMRLDADEYLDEILLNKLTTKLAEAPKEITAFEVKRPTTFLGKRISHGGMSPWLLRFWRRGTARCEPRWMDEHMAMVHGGAIRRLPGYLVDDNLNGLTWWANKHNRYASREALDYLLSLHDAANRNASNPPVVVGQARRKRLLKTNMYYRLPLGLRPWVYWAWRMFVRGGVLDGYRGIMFHTLQGLWYRQLVDGKIMQVNWLMQRQGADFDDAVRQCLAIDLDGMLGPAQTQSRDI